MHQSTSQNIPRILPSLRTALRWELLRRIRRNHALEHATVRVLQENFPRLRISGYSHEGGFTLMGNIPPEAAEKAAQDALGRLRAGRRELAIHPQCGTNLVVQGMLCTLVGFLGFAGIGWRRAFARFNLVSMLMLLTVLTAPLLGMAAQARITTDGDVGPLQITAVERRQLRLPIIGTLTVHRVRTRNG